MRPRRRMNAAWPRSRPRHLLRGTRWWSASLSFSEGRVTSGTTARSAGGHGCRAVIHGGAPMNHATRVALALVLGAGLATAAQAQDTYSQGAAPKGQSAAPAMNNMQDAAPTARMKRATPGRGHK